MKRIFHFFILILLVSSFAVFGQNNKPTTKNGLVKTLRSKQFQTRQIVGFIEQRGVDFKLTPDVEEELIAAGARPQVIEAVRNNYRGTTVANVGKKPPVNNNNNNSGSDDGALTKDRLLKNLRSKSVSNGALLDMIERNGVSFETTSSVEKELAAAGASPAIITAVKNAYQGGNRASFDDNDSGSSFGGSSRYESMIEQAIESYNRDVNANLPANSEGRVEAIKTLVGAAKLEPNNPVAFQQLGFMTLYGTLNGFTASEANFRKAIELGGSAVFRVFHDHDGIFQDTCQGSLYVSKDGVRFESDDNKHTFDATDSNIKQVKTNSSWKRAFQTKSGSFKIVLNDQSDKDGKKFSFAPLTDNIEESKMVIRLIGKS
jgi:hypothetical protein